MIVLYNIGYGGAAKILSFVSNGLADRGHSVFVYTYAGKECFYQLNEKIDYIPAENIRVNYLGKMLYSIDVIRNVKVINPDVIVSFLPNSNVFSILGGTFSKIPVIISERGDPYSEKGLLLSLKKYFYRFADGFVFQTEMAKNYYRNSLPLFSEIIPNPVTIKRVNRLSQKERRNDIAFVGRFFVKQKRQDIMLKAFKEVAAKNVDARLVFYGDGPDLSIIEEMAKDLGISERVIFKGRVDKIAAEIKNCKMFVLTSDYEGIPNALIEAMALGLPSIATNCSPGGARLLIQDQENGLLVPKGDVHKIAEAILFLLDNPQKADKIGLKAQDIIERFQPDKILDLWENFIIKVVSHNE